jgi:Holliday junction resolvase RusA-like endonuclease
LVSDRLTLLLGFTVFGKPEPRGSKTGKFHRDSNTKSYPWMSKVSEIAALAMEEQPLFTGALRIDLDFYLARPQGHYGSGRNADKLKPSAPTRPCTKPDVGKLARGTIDAMEGVVFRNDSQQVEGEPRKFYGAPTRCEVRISKVLE